MTNGPIQLCTEKTNNRIYRCGPSNETHSSKFVFVHQNFILKITRAEGELDFIEFFVQIEIRSGGGGGGIEQGLEQGGRGIHNNQIIKLPKYYLKLYLVLSWYMYQSS